MSNTLYHVFNPTEFTVFNHISHIRPNHLSGYMPVPMWPDNRGRTVVNQYLHAQIYRAKTNAKICIMYGTITAPIPDGPNVLFE